VHIRLFVFTCIFRVIFFYFTGVFFLFFSGDQVCLRMSYQSCTAEKKIEIVFWVEIWHMQTPLEHDSSLVCIIFWKIIFLYNINIGRNGSPNTHRMYVLFIYKIMTKEKRTVNLWAIFDQNFDFWAKFRFLSKIWIFDQNLDFWPKFGFLSKNFDF